MSEPATAPTTDPMATAPAADPAPAAQPAASETDLAAELAEAKADAARWKSLSRLHESRAKANHESAETAKAREAAIKKIAEELGIETPKPDPDEIARELASTRAEAKRHAAQLAVLRAAVASGADGDALLDSNAFLTQLDGIDAANPEAVRELVASAVERNPKFKAAAAVPAQPVRQASGAGDFNGAPGAARQLGAADVARMSPAQVKKAKDAGLLDEYLRS